MARSFARASSQYLEATSAVATSIPITFAAWCWTSNTTDTKDVLSLGSSTSNNIFLFRATAAGTIQAIIYDNGSPGTANTTSAFPQSTWFHGCAVFESSTLRSIYIDGGDKGTNTTDLTPSNINTTDIGCYMYGGTRGSYWDGSIAEAAIWNAALTDAEVLILSKGISPLAVRPGNLAFYVPLVRDNDEDIIGGLSLTASGSPTIAAHPWIRYPFTPFYYMTTGAEPPADLSIDIGLDEAAYQGTGVRII